uniref:Uncharacterized protein n=1 Tax=Anopheles coluzzii TaxID=1518534 RepID=A0A8W7PGE7_ANOCL
MRLHQRPQCTASRCRPVKEYAPDAAVHQGHRAHYAGFVRQVHVIPGAEIGAVFGKIIVRRACHVYLCCRSGSRRFRTKANRVTVALANEAPILWVNSIELEPALRRHGIALHVVLLSVPYAPVLRYGNHIDQHHWAVPDRMTVAASSTNGHYPTPSRPRMNAHSERSAFVVRRQLQTDLHEPAVGRGFLRPEQRVRVQCFVVPVGMEFARPELICCLILPPEQWLGGGHRHDLQLLPAKSIDNGTINAFGEQEP